MPRLLAFFGSIVIAVYGVHMFYVGFEHHNTIREYIGVIIAFIGVFTSVSILFIDS